MCRVEQRTATGLEDVQTCPILRQFVPRVLISLFRKPIDDGLSRFIVPDNSCHVPPTAILKYGKEIKKFSAEPDNLIIFVRLDISETNSPPIAVLRTDFYRANPKYSNLDAQVYLGQSVAIPLNLPPNEILQRLQEFVKRCFG